MTPPDQVDALDDQIDIKVTRYPEGSRFIGPGDDVVISAAKLSALLVDARIDELNRFPIADMAVGDQVQYIANRIKELEKQREANNG